MPHDKNGSLLEVGDLVLMRCKVTEISESEGETDCNVTLEATERPEGEEYFPTIACNSRLVVKGHAVIFRCLPGQRVRLHLNGLVGIVRNADQDRDGIRSFSVEFVTDNGQIERIWIREDECNLEDAPVPHC